MMPYETYRLYQIERPRTAPEIRIADERAGRTAAAVAQMLRPLVHPRRPRLRPTWLRPSWLRPSWRAEKMTERIGSQ